MNNKLLAYALDFVSFYIQKTSQLELVKEVILFGSVVQGSETKESDIDLFFNVSKINEKSVQEEIVNIEKEFYNSTKYKDYWKALGITNRLHCLVGELSEWQLKDSIQETGLTLYGKHLSTSKSLAPRYIISLSQSNNRNRNLSIWRNLYGYRQKVGSKVYQTPGLLVKLNGEKISRGTFIIPAQHLSKIDALLKSAGFQRKITLVRR